MTGTLAVICKQPLPGRVKTRLTPPFTPRAAAELATAALADTFAAVAAAACQRRVAVLDGDPGPWVPAEIDVIPQRGRGLGERLAAAFEDIGSGPLLLIGMDTPQVTPRQLEDGLRRTVRSGSALGPAADGGFWAVGVAEPCSGLFDGVPMSTARTGARQLQRMRAHGLDPALLETLVDVDDAATAEAVAAHAPETGFARLLGRVAAGGRVSALMRERPAAGVLA